MPKARKIPPKTSTTSNSRHRRRRPLLPSRTPRRRALRERRRAAAATRRTPPPLPPRRRHRPVAVAAAAAVEVGVARRDRRPRDRVRRIRRRNRSRAPKVINEQLSGLFAFVACIRACAQFSLDPPRWGVFSTSNHGLLHDLAFSKAQAKNMSMLTTGLCKNMYFSATEHRGSCPQTYIHATCSATRLFMHIKLKPQRP